MVKSDPFQTQRDVGVDVVTELSAAGFEDAQEIGRGGFGEVYRCIQRAVDRTVAVKVLTGEVDENRERFFREQRAMGRLTGHPNIVDVLEVGETASGLPYLVMRYHSHGSLDARIRRDGPLSVAEVLHLGVKIAGALETAHRAEILHRDIKPGNILLTDYGEPALTDFGIAHIAGGFETATGTVTGSPAFTAPEVLGGDAPSRASDVYGLGATLFCALTGHAAFERRSGEQVVAQFLRITKQPVPDLRKSGMPDDVCAVIEAAMSRDSRDRPTAAELGRQLQQVEHNHGFAVDEMALRGEAGADRVSAVTSVSVVGSGIGNLPLELTSFVDRRIQVAEVKNLLAGSRLVTMTGMGGVGKTRLALRVAQMVKGDFADGVWLVELGDLRDATLVVDVVAAALGLRNQSARPKLEVMAESLASRNLLLVLDNCEQVIDAVATLTESLLRTCPQLRILATSREALSVGGESLFAVPPLGIPDPTDKSALHAAARYDAVTLFAERGAAAVPGFELTDDTRLTVARICARLDGLPLAIELAAARLRTMSPEQILSRLDDRYDLLTRGHRGAPMRQQTLRWCIGWSYDLCTPVEQLLWNQLSVFAGGFELDAAEQVCGTDLTEPELLDALSALVDKSILIREETDGTIRFRMLETVQEYGKEKAEESGKYLEYARRHRQWCERLATQAETEWVGPHQLQLVARLERELPNLRKALEFSLAESNDCTLRMTAALHMFWTLRGRLSEGRHWCERALGHTTGAPTTDRAKALHVAGVTAAMQGDLPVVTDTMTQLRTLAEQTAEPLVTALLAHAEGNMCLAGGNGDLARAGALLAHAVDTYEASGNLKLQLDARISLGWAYALHGDTERALADLDKGLAITESAGETMLRAWLSWAAGFTVWRRDEPERAVHLLQQGIRSSRLVADPLVAGACLETLAWIAADQHHARRAAVLMGAADSLGRVTGGSALMFRDLHVYRDECVRSIRNALGERAFEAARQQGAAMSFDTAVGFALGERAEATEPASRSAENLTKRERQVADLVARGLTNKAIAARLVISQRTAEGHVEHILTKLGFTSRAQIAAWAADHHSPQPGTSA
ncbi:protein kinase [Nocardia sp. NBC_00565]|uniref:protein kinase domain-containing protein n=1 Tax=Nocardia sp. NBC_00565 TaxID=2975993 RepID=UPI002E8050A5|nr:protein kinase [Nocardia sp. NBC_00565]WUC03887.1 protein kinase [Nocardia sp. NBC_00565]